MIKWRDMLTLLSLDETQQWRDDIQKEYDEAKSQYDILRMRRDAEIIIGRMSENRKTSTSDKSKPDVIHLMTNAAYTRVRMLQARLEIMNDLEKMIMNKRQKKKFRKRCFVYKYRDFKKAAKLFIEVMTKARDYGIILKNQPIPSHFTLGLWRDCVNVVRRYDDTKLAYSHLRFARHLDPKLVPDEVKIPSICMTERTECEYKPVSSACESNCERMDCSDELEET